MIDIIKRTTLMVRDANAAAQWYATVFGMRRWMDVPFTLSGEQLAVGKKGDQTRLIIMQAEHDVIGMIGLLEWLEPKQQFPAQVPKQVSFGAPIFVVAAVDCRATTDRARAGGSHVHCEPRAWTVTGANGQPKSMIGASFFDLDGYFYEVNETLA
jgi:catechol 2,3-dioxygenase-like lactoylglutathione lyase family enzyme